MRVLVTGASGFVGQALLPQLIKEQHTAVYALLRASDPAFPFPAEQIVADLRDYEQTARALRQVQPDAVIHLAAVGAIEPFLKMETAVDSNVIATVNLLRACFQQKIAVGKLIVARTPGERSGMNPYAASKAAAWNFCAMAAHTWNWPVYGAMIFQAYGVGQSPKAFIPAAIAAAQAGQDFPMTDGAQKKDWIHVNDVAAGLTAVLHANLPPGTTIELGAGKATSVADTAKMIYQIVGGNGRPLIGQLPNRPGEQPLQLANAAATEQMTGWKTAVTLKQGLTQLCNNTIRP